MSAGWAETPAEPETYEAQAAGPWSEAIASMGPTWTDEEDQEEKETESEDNALDTIRDAHEEKEEEEEEDDDNALDAICNAPEEEAEADDGNDADGGDEGD